jgi:DNA-binding transcriptional regulator YdaS (Cro superfamily)
VSDRGIQEALYSQSVQSGRQGNEIIINQARNTLGDVSRSSPAQQLDAIYSARTAYASQYASVSATTNRYALEFVRAQRISNYYQNYFAPR